MAVLIIITISVSVIQHPLALQVDEDTLVSLSSVKIIWEKIYGGTSDDRAFHAVTVSNGFLVVGSSKSIVANSTVGWALMLDNDGEAVWNRTFLCETGTEVRYAISLTDGFLLVGNQFLASGDVNGYVAKINNQGELQWETAIGGEKTDKLFSGVASQDGFTVFGASYSYSNGEGAAWIVKLNSNGNVVWNNIYPKGADSALRSGVCSQAGDYVATGYADISGEGNYDFYLIKVDTNGDMVWDKTFGSVESQKGYSMAASSDGYILVGETVSLESSTDAWVLKVDFEGNKLWSKNIGGLNSDSPAYVTNSKDGNFLVCGFTFSFGAGERDFWLFKITNEGQVQFTLTHGTKAFQEAYYVLEVENSEFIMVGWTDPIGRPDLIGLATYDFYIVKLGVGDNSTANPWFTLYAVVVFAALAATLILLIKLRTKVKK